MMGFRAGLKNILQRFTRSQSGNVAMMAGVALPVLLMISAAAIDLHNAAKVQSELQDALDAATLAAARSSSTNNADIQRIGMSSMRANMPGYYLPESDKDVATFTLDSRYRVVANATVQVKTIVANVFLPPYGKIFDDYLPMSANSQVLRASRHVEVAMALDVTGSMDDYMQSLRDAAKELVGIVVQGDQQLFTTKVALVPYAAGVNMGTETQAAAMRGALVGSKSITKATRLEDRVQVGSVNNTTKEFTLNGHGLVNGDVVYATSFRSGANINDKTLTVTRVNDNVFKLSSVTSSTNLGTTRGYIQKCITRNCDMVLTADNHGLSSGEYVHVSGVSTTILAATPAAVRDRNNNITSYSATYVSSVLDANRFVVDSSASTTASWTGNGTLTCGRDGCERRIFTNKNDRLWWLGKTTCVSERPRGSASPSDRPASSGNYLGRAYLDNTCPSTPFMALTNSTSTLNTAIDTLRSGGSTAGQVGVEMAWYAISPNFGAINGTTPRPFNTQETVKAVILMTDGEFNIPFCQGVIAKDALSDGSGSDSHKINCNATNGNAFTQAYDTCRAMKQQGIVVYSVAFKLGDKTLSGPIDTAYEVMHYCATDPNDNFFVVESGTNLTEAFKAIGRDITRLRIAR